MTGAALGRTAGHDVAELLSSAELKSVRAGEGEDALDANNVVVVNSHGQGEQAQIAASPSV